MRKLSTTATVKRLSRPGNCFVYATAIDLVVAAWLCLVECWQFVLQSWSGWPCVSRYVGRSRNTRRRRLIVNAPYGPCTPPALRESFFRRFVRCAPLGFGVVLPLVSSESGQLDTATTAPRTTGSTSHGVSSLLRCDACRCSVHGDAEIILLVRALKIVVARG